MYVPVNKMIKPDDLPKGYNSDKSNPNGNWSKTNPSSTQHLHVDFHKSARSALKSKQLVMVLVTNPLSIVHRRIMIDLCKYLK